ncbi:hypothetical protein NL676_018141 [Syzygium grande]|nr:hypothetical protein NL676_018141 [Syzygium grande]
MAAAILLTRSAERKPGAAMIGRSTSVLFRLLLRLSSDPTLGFPLFDSIPDLEVRSLERLGRAQEIKRGRFGPQGIAFFEPMVFEYVCEEEWYDTDLALHCDMIQLLGKNKMVALAEVVFSGLLKEGIEPDTRAYAEMFGAYLRVDMVEKAMQTYEKMKAAGRDPNEFTMMILIRNLEKAREKDLVEFVKRDYVEYLDSPKKFLEEVDRKYSVSPLSIVVAVIVGLTRRTGWVMPLRITVVSATTNAISSILLQTVPFSVFLLQFSFEGSFYFHGQN